MKKKKNTRRNKKKRAQLENINPHKPTSEASICKSGFPKTIPLRFFYKAKSSFLVMRSEQSRFFVKS